MNKISFLFIILLCSLKLSFASEVSAITDFNSSAYLGTWYEIARLPNTFEKKCSIPIIANYSTNPDNNEQLIVTNQCTIENDKLNIANGNANFVSSTTIGKLEVTFLPKWLRWLPFIYGDYWVLYTDYDTVSVVGSPNHEYLWVLSRTKSLNYDVLAKAILIAQDQGFDTSKLIFNYQSESQVNESI
jgi:apolipoprotein D and lipocalin family protein